jgi:magnesium chelatase accessory protein
MLQRRHLLLDGLRVSFLEKGTAAAGEQSLVLLHGLMGTAETFRPMLEALPEGVHVVAVDFPGSGESERRDGLDATMSAIADIVLRMLDELQLDRPCLMGHSHGAAVALRIGRTRPEKVRSLVLLSPAHPYFKEGDPVVRFYLSLPGRLVAYSMPWYPRWVQMIGLRRMAGARSSDTLSRLKPYRDNLRTPGTISHLLRLLRTWHEDMAELRMLMRKPVTLATLMLWGDSDKAVPVESASELRAHVERSELVVLPGVGHRPAEERAELTAEIVGQWMRRAELTPRYRPNVSESQDRMTAFMSPSFEAGD